jgi:hypothetical protein
VRTRTPPSETSAPGRVDAQGTGAATLSAVFAFLWAAAHIAHAWHQGGDASGAHLRDPWLILVLIAGIASAVRPRSGNALALLAVAQLVAFAIQYPFVANHWTMAAFINAGILVALARGARGARVREVDTTGLVTATASYNRVVFVTAYSAAAIAKLNHDFLDIVHSCALVTFEQIAAWVGLEAPGAIGVRAAVVGVVTVTELSVPVLLLIPRTRRLGIILAAVFHLVLASTPTVVVMDFTLIVVALSLLFAPTDVGVRLREDLRSFGSTRPAVVGAIVRFRRSITALVVVMVMVLAVGRRTAFGYEAWATLTWGTFLIFGAVATAVLVSALATSRSTGVGSELVGKGATLGAAHLVLIAVLTVNVASPYIGLKTTSSFTMFSNLRTEGGASNHLLIPQFGVFAYQDDLVQVHSTSNQVLAERVRDGQMVTYHELRRQLAADPSASIAFTRGGERFDLDVAADVEELVTPRAWEQKLLHFRPVPVGSPVCQP